MRALLVEDELMLLDLLTDCFKALGVSIVSAPDGKAAMEAIAVSSQPFDALICDGNLPFFKGPEVARFFNDKYPQSPICLISGHLDATTLYGKEMKGLPATIISKPCSPESVIEWVKAKYKELNGGKDAP